MPLPPRGNVLVLVLGDVGRSPRMQYHSLSLLRSDYCVHLAGYSGSALIDDLLHRSCTERLREWRFDPALPFSNLSFCRKNKLLKPFYYLLRLLALLFLPLVVLLRALLSTFYDPSSPSCGFDYVILQTPPAVPTLFIGALLKAVSWLLTGKRCELIFDWHNIGYTMFDESETTLRTLTRMYEKTLGPLLGDHHLCVSRGMKAWLKTNFSLDATVLHDRPPSFFKPTTVSEAHSLFTRLSPEFSAAESFFNLPPPPPSAGRPCTTLFTQAPSSGGVPEWREGRPELIVSSTSWTPDEDFDMLLDALKLFDAQAPKGAGGGGPKLLVVVTGKGPLRDFYVSKMSSLSLSRVHVMTIWLSQSDYPLLLGCSSLGVSLHTSSSGVDLPMKVQDMHGCGVPVAAVHFECVEECVTEGRNGRIFKDTVSLKDVLSQLFGDDRRGELERLRKGVESGVRWDENWRGILGKTLAERDEARKKYTKWDRLIGGLGIAAILVWRFLNRASQP